MEGLRLADEWSVIQQKIESFDEIFVVDADIPIPGSTIDSANGIDASLAGFAAFCWITPFAVYCVVLLVD